VPGHQFKADLELRTDLKVSLFKPNFELFSKEFAMRLGGAPALRIKMGMERYFSVFV
jgi:hypothetical protein